jgi:hypothetical protein
MEITPVFNSEFETIRITRYFESFIIDIWFKSEDIRDLEVSQDDVKDIGRVVGADLESLFKQEAKPGSSFLSMKDVDIDYGLYSVKVRSVYFGRCEFEVKTADIDGMGKRIEASFSDNAAKIVDEIESKRTLDASSLEMIEKQVFKTKK